MRPNQRTPYRPQPRRSQIRAYFAAPLLTARPKPIPPLQLGRWGTIRWGAWILFALFAGLTGYALFKGWLDWIVFCGAVALVLMVIGLIAGDRVTTLRANHAQAERTYNLSLAAYKDDLNTWGLSETDLDNRATVKEVDERLKSDLIWLRDHRALERLGLVKEHLGGRDPIQVAGPLTDSTLRAPNRTLAMPQSASIFLEHEETSARRAAEDGLIRFPWYDIMVLCLTETHIALYEAEYNFLQGPDHLGDDLPDSVISQCLINERTYEFLYHDIVSVSTMTILLHHAYVVQRDNVAEMFTPAVPAIMPEERYSVLKWFTLSVLGDQAVSVGVTLGDITEKDLPEPLRLDFERHLQFIRTMVREKKGG